MNRVLNISDPAGGAGAAGISSRPKIKPEPEAAAEPRGETAGAEVFFQTADGEKRRGTPLRFTRHLAIFEWFHPGTLPQFSEALDDFKIILQNQARYVGRAVVQNVLHAGAQTICEARLDENSWHDGASGSGPVREQFRDFLQAWQKSYLVAAEYKAVVADLQSFLNDLRLWLERVELELRATSAAERARREMEIAGKLRAPVLAVLAGLFERFEAVSDRIPEEERPAHRAFGRRQLHPHLLGAPFFHRTYTKPLGYAGDHEMMSMIVRNELAGDSLYARLVNAYLLDHAPCRAVRNRVSFLKRKIIAETGRVARAGQAATIFSLGCGPAREVVEFLDEHPLAKNPGFQLLDFNEAALAFVGGKLAEVKTGGRCRRRCGW